MKLRSLPKLRKRAVEVLLFAVLMVSADTFGQMPDCISGQYMYGVFTPIIAASVTPPVGTDSTEIRPIAFSNGAVGGLMGGRRYFIRRGSSGAYYYGASAMAMDEVTAKFYLITQMGSAANKDIIMIDPLAPTATGTVIATIGSAVAPSATNLTNYHFVKAAARPGGAPKYGYAVGVSANTGTASNRFSPLIRWNLCATTNCATAGLMIVGYLQGGGIMDRMNLYNGDISFDAAGNLYFFAAGYFNVGGSGRYTDARLFRINAANIPNTAGTGNIPMTFVADFDGLDSTGASGVCFDATGNLYMTTRRYNDNSDLSGGGFTTELYASYDTSTTVLLPGFNPSAGYSAGDLASCYFPNSILAQENVKLLANYLNGQVKLKWEVISNENVTKYELQRSNDGENFETIATITPGNSNTYTYIDPQNGTDKYKYYRVRQCKTSGIRFYSNMAKVRVNSKITLASQLSPNPFIDNFNVNIDVKSAGVVRVRILDQSGRVMQVRKFNCNAGINKLSVIGLGNLTKGIYVVEIGAEEELIREKMIKE